MLTDLQNGSQSQNYQTNISLACFLLNMLKVINRLSPKKKTFKIQRFEKTTTSKEVFFSSEVNRKTTSIYLYFLNYSTKYQLSSLIPF